MTSHPEYTTQKPDQNKDGPRRADPTSSGANKRDYMHEEMEKSF